MSQTLPPTNEDTTFFFPAFERLADYLLEKEISPETTGFIVGRATRDLWLGAAAEAQKTLSDVVFDEIEKEDDINARFQLLVVKYKDATGVDMYERLNIAAEAIVNEIINGQASDNAAQMQ